MTGRRRHDDVKPEEANRVLVIEMRGMISQVDIDNTLCRPRAPLCSSLGATSWRDCRPDRRFVDWEHLTGWERGAETLGTITGKTSGDVVHKVAIVADEKWRDEVPGPADMGKQSEVRFFRVENRDKA